MEELALHILDLVQNSIAGGATGVSAEVVEDIENNLLSIAIRDNGRGMPEELAQRAFDPFVTTRNTRKVGLGLPLLKSAAEQAGGGARLTTHPGAGTTVEAWFQHDHLDRAPLGNLPATVSGLVALNPELSLTFRHRRGDREYTLDTEAIRRMVAPVSLSQCEVLSWIRDYLKENEESLEV
jgi:hypothetical protein